MRPHPHIEAELLPAFPSQGAGEVLAIPHAAAGEELVRPSLPDPFHEGDAAILQDHGTNPQPTPVFVRHADFPAMTFRADPALNHSICSAFRLWCTSNVSFVPSSW